MQIFTIEENDASQRLDKFLKKLFPRATRNLIYKFNRTNKIKVKSYQSDTKFQKKENAYKLNIGDEIKIFLHDTEINSLCIHLKPSISGKLENLSCAFDTKDILFEDESILVVNKNPGINVHPGDNKTKELSLIQSVHDYLENNKKSLTFKPSLIHRIDRNTSGIVMIAKKKSMLSKLMSDLKSHPNSGICKKQNFIHKIYYAIVLGKLSRKKGVIKKKLLRIEGAKNENKVQISKKGKSAITHYSLIKEHCIKIQEKEIFLSEVEIHIETGRMHQIRVHMASIKHPIVGDKSYGNKKINAYFERYFGLQRQALHARKIEFFHYDKKSNVKLKANLKKDISDFIKKILSIQ